MHDRLVYEFIEEDIRDDPPADMGDLDDLDVEEWDISDKVWKERYQTALDDVKELSSDERVAKLKKIELKREDDGMRDRLAFHRTSRNADRDGVSRYDWDARRVLAEGQKKELDPLTHEQLVEETAKLDEWEKSGKSADAAFLRDQLLYAHVELEVEKRREALPKNPDESYWTPGGAEWMQLYTEAKAKVDAIPKEQHAQKVREIEAQQEQIYRERQQASSKAESREMVGALASGFFQTMFSPLDILFVLLALSTAYRIGSHGFSKN